ncbi:hypothetical protein KPL47_06895 [Clostridium estertheticum]|uniref:hypothetical protein n=1 Tax=Clostridium estertheticum TaxID=238834 RepID=UPI001C0B97FE|nr:hypothetical protein [Clostridium estertheticum]MBU3176094.1 hypothetical protein [Clostridium estertheticum]
MRLKTQTKLLIDANNKDVEDMLYKQYLVDYRNMDAEHFTNFEDYKLKAFGPKVKAEKLDKEKILSDAEKIKMADQKEGK